MQLREHLRSVRVWLTLAWLLVVLAQSISDRGDDLLVMLGMVFLGFLLALSWLIVAAQAVGKHAGKKRLRGLVLEAGFSLGFLLMCWTQLPFYLMFPLSRPALERLAATTPLPPEPHAARRVDRWVGLIYVYKVSRDREGNTQLLIHSNMSYAHYLTYCPKAVPEKFEADTPFLGKHWYRGSAGM